MRQTCLLGNCIALFKISSPINGDNYLYKTEFVEFQIVFLVGVRLNSKSLKSVI